MKKIELLDCTLRDGGYVNDWNFGAKSIRNIFLGLARAGIENIEVGFLDDRRKFDINRTIQPNTESFDKLFNGINKYNSKVFAMIDYGTCDISNISHARDSFIDGIRIIFKKPNFYNAVNFAKQIKAKGYLVTLQLVSITSYKIEELEEYSKIINELKPFAVSIVDTYGLLDKKLLLNYFYCLNNNLNTDICIAYHGHNNFQLGYSNGIDIIETNHERDILIDGTLYGMGKSAGNTPIELLLVYLNNIKTNKYNIDDILEIIDNIVLRIYDKQYWGYNFQFFISGLNKCHPNYVRFLLNKKTLSIKAINEIINMIPKYEKLNYNDKIISNLYIKYQKQSIKKENFAGLIDNLNLNDKIFLIGPGHSLVKYQNDIKSLCNTNILTISVNFIPDNIDVDYLFITNSKRFSVLYHDGIINDFNGKIITTSNIIQNDIKFDYVLNYQRLLDRNENIVDNSLAMMFNLLLDTQIRTIYLAGFDGFDKDEIYNYCSEYLEISTDFERLLKVNDSLKEKIKKIKSKKEIIFITPSLYEEK